MDSSIGDRIRAARKKAGMTQQTFAESLGVTQSVIAKYEAGSVRVTAEVMEKIASVTGTSLNVLYGNNTIKDTTDDLLLNEIYNSLNDTGKRRLREYLDELMRLYPK